MRLPRHTPLGVIVALALLALPVSAAASTTTSANWSGYAVHGHGVSFRRIAGRWTVPKAVCTPGSASYSAAWVGIGGYNLTSPALEQTGTETDCSRQGHASSFAWYELVPAPSHSMKLRIRAGDRIAAGVRVAGHRVTLTLHDLTSHRAVTKTISLKTVDVSSAEWIVEAPSECQTASSCQPLPLADFGSVGFTRARVQNARGQAGSIGDRRWQRTKITLSSGANRFVSEGVAQENKATPSPLSKTGAGFTVAFSSIGGAPSPGTGAPVTASEAAFPSTIRLR
jgi:Peptidase A4 family